MMFSSTSGHACFSFQAAAGGVQVSKRAAHALVGEVSRLVNEGALQLSNRRFAPAQIIEIFALQDAGAISSTAAREVLAEVLQTGKQPAAVVQEKGLAQLTDASALEAAADAVLSASPAEVEKYKAGKKTLLSFFVGRAMRDLKGKGNPGVLTALFKKKLGD